MKNRFIKLTLTAVVTSAALIFSNISAVAANENTVAGVVVIDEETMAKNNAYAEAYEKFYEEALQEEMSKIDFDKLLDEVVLNPNAFLEDPHAVVRRKAEERAEEKCETLGLSAAIELTPIDGAAWTSWYGTFSVDSIENTVLEFTSPDYFSCTVGGRTGTITARYGYIGNFKSVSVDITYSDGTTDHKYERSNKSLFSVTASYKNKTIVKATYKFTILNGTGSTADYLEMAIVNLVKNGT